MLARPFPARVVAALAVMAALWGAAPCGAQPAPGSRWEPDRLRRAIEERYRVAPVRDGVVLVPRRDAGDVKSIEVTGDAVAINGSTVTGGELRDRLKGDADAILALSYLEPSARTALFEGGQGVTAPHPGEAPAEVGPPATTPEPPAISRHTAGQSARIHIGGDVQVAENESVDGPVVAVGGSANIDGEVSQDVVAIGGDVHLGRTARVLGDVTTVGGRIDRDPGAEVSGKLNDISVRLPRLHIRPSFWLPATIFMGRTIGPWVEVVATLSRMLLVGLLAAFALLIARSPVARIERVAAVEPWKAGLVGLLTELLFVPVFILTIVVLAISIVGIPLLLFVPPLTILALAAALVLGFTGVAYRVGRWVEERFHWGAQGPFLALFVGLMCVWAITIAGRFVGLGGWPVWMISSALLVVGFLVEYVAWTVGLGAAVMTRLGSRPGGVTPVVVPPVPPTPPPPEVASPRVGA